MSLPYDHPGREAERLRIIVETLAYTNPGMTMDEAKTVIPEIEKRTAKLEAPEKPTGYITLPDSLPETAAKFIDLQPDIQALIPTKKINAIKELRARTYLGLKEAKEGVEHWDRTRRGTAVPATPFLGTSPKLMDDIADWIDGEADIIDFLIGTTTSPPLKINGIKETRLRSPFPCGLKEAKDACEHWIRTRPKK